jgi:TonB family protein
MGLDEKAVDAVKLWRFEPARKTDGTPVDVYASIEVNFKLR